MPESEIVQIEGKYPCLYFDKQANNTIYHNTDKINDKQNWNRFQKVCSNSDKYESFKDEAIQFLNDNDVNNEYYIDMESLQIHHIKLFRYYDNQEFYQRTKDKTKPNPRINRKLWFERFNSLNSKDNRVPIYAKSGVVADVSHVYFKGTVPSGDDDTPSKELKDEAWELFQSVLLPNISITYLEKIEDHKFLLKCYFDEDESGGSTSSPIRTISERESPKNWLWFGSPGTGKSFGLKKRAMNLIEDKEKDWYPYSFSPATTYGDFVGEYRPKMIYNSEGKANYRDIKGSKLNPERPGDPAVDYVYVPGIFMKALIRARTIDTAVVLMVDEINRGDMYEILGEIFQLMERDSSGKGEYEMPLHPEAMDFFNVSLYAGKSIEDLKNLCESNEIDYSHIIYRSRDYNSHTVAELKKFLKAEALSEKGKKLELIERLVTHEKKLFSASSNENGKHSNEIKLVRLLADKLGKDKIRLPKNLYIWGTMNPNDTSVQQIDSAFFRRWIVKHIDINYLDEHSDKTPLQMLPAGPLEMENWDDFRVNLNKQLIELRIDEEDLIGRWFIKKKEFGDWERFYSKLVFHLANNVLKMRLNESESIFQKKSVMEIMEQCRKGENPFIDRVTAYPDYSVGKGKENLEVLLNNVEPDSKKVGGLKIEKPEPIDYDSHTVLDLKKLLRGRGLAVSGRKAELIDRLESDEANSDMKRPGKGID